MKLAIARNDLTVAFSTCQNHNLSLRSQSSNVCGLAQSCSLLHPDVQVLMSLGTLAEQVLNVTYV